VKCKAQKKNLKKNQGKGRFERDQVDRKEPNEGFPAAFLKRTGERFGNHYIRNLYRRLARTRFTAEVEIHKHTHTYIQKYTHRLLFITIPCDFRSPRPHDWAFHLATMSTACQVASSDSGASRVNYWFTTKTTFVACFWRILRLQTADMIRRQTTHRQELQWPTERSSNLVKGCWFT